LDLLVGPPLNYGLDKFTKIKRIYQQAIKEQASHLAKILEKIKINCCENRPNAFWSRHKYYVDFPYVEKYKGFPQKASTNLMNPKEQKMCKEEIRDLLDKGLIEKRSPWACPM
jgi:hypothetical protein